MADIVTIKSFPGGLDILLDDSVSFDEIVYAAGKKFKDSAKFFGKAKVAISFRGRELSEEEEDLLLDTVTENCQVEICCVIEQDPSRGEVYLRALDRFAEATEAARSHVYKGTLKSGETLETPFSVVILGDVNPGARVISAGNVIILGTLYGSVFAGRVQNHQDDDRQDPAKEGLVSLKGADCFIIAQEMKPTTLRIDSFKAKQGEKDFKLPRFSKGYAKIARVEDGKIVVDAITRDFLENLPM